MAHSDPYLSVVVTSRNDDHGQSLLRRMQTFVNALVGQCQRHGLDAELIIVEWNPPADRPRFIEALRWPETTAPCRVRIIEVPPELHRRFKHAENLPLFQMIGKNVGIRRARGRFILATNIDIIFSDELMSALTRGELKRCRMYRIDRHDVMTDVPVFADVTEQLRYCETHLLRVNCREGTFELTPDGCRTVAPEDIAPQDMGVRFEKSWYPVENWNGEVYRWVGQDAVLAVPVPGGPARALCLEVEPGPGVKSGPFELEVRDTQEQILARGVVECRQWIHLTMPLPAAQLARLQLHTVDGGRPSPFDPRILNFRVLRCRWVDQAETPADESSPERVHFWAKDAYVLAKEDIVPPEMGLRFGRGWHGFERWDGEPFRWVGDDAGLAVTLPSAAAPVLSLEVEPGPGVENRPFWLQVRDASGRTVARGLVAGRQVIYLTLPLSPGQTRCFQLHAEGGGRPTSGGSRILNFRILRCDWVDGSQLVPTEPTDGTFHFQSGDVFQLAPEDIATPDMGLRFGRGWYPVERDEGLVYRWVSDDASLAVAAPPGAGQLLSLEVRPGPGVDHQPFTLQVQDHGGRTVAQGVIAGREIVHLLLPLRPGQTEYFRLRVLSGGRRIPSDPRVLNFNVLRCFWSENWKKINALKQADDAYNFKTEDVYLLAEEDIAPADMGLRFGRGWCPAEVNQGVVSRWVGDDAGIAVDTPAGPENVLSLELQPGPGVERGPFALQIQDRSGRIVAQGLVAGREIVHLLLPLRPGRTETFRLRVPGGGRRIASDPRLLNFNVLRCFWSKNWEGIDALPQPEGSHHLKTEDVYMLAEIDIASPETGLRFGRGWHPVEMSNSEPCRWAGQDAALAVGAQERSGCVLSMEMRPGPGVGAKPFFLRVNDTNGQTVAQGMVEGRKTVHVLLPLRPGHEERFWLRADRGGKRIASDVRILDFRVSRCYWTQSWEVIPSSNQPADAFNFKTEDPYELEEEDVASAEMGLRFGRGWHVVERNNGARYRWVGEDAAFAVRAPDKPEQVLNFEVQPGPGVGHGPFTLRVHDARGQAVARVAIEGRKLVTLKLPVRAGQTERFLFQTEGGGRRIASDPRIMNFAVFRCFRSEECPVTRESSEAVEGRSNGAEPRRGFEKTHRPLRDFMPSLGHGQNGLPRPNAEGKPLGGDGALLSPGTEKDSAHAEHDVVAADSGLRLEAGWGPLVHEDDQYYRWVKDGAEFSIQEMSDTPVKTLSLDLEPSTGRSGRGLQVQIRDARDRLMAREKVEGRQKVHLMLRVRPGKVERFYLHLEEDGQQEPRSRNGPALRIFHCAWSKPGTSVPDHEIISPLSLHTCACGDFTLLARGDWFELLGYPEFEMFSLHIDSVLCYLAHHHGIIETMLEDPMRIYHIEHGTGSGWTPEGAAKLMERIAAKGISCLECQEVLAWATEMRRLGRPLVLNYEDWGMPNAMLPETIVGEPPSQNGSG
jgi:hypothetical protein